MSVVDLTVKTVKETSYKEICAAIGPELKVRGLIFTGIDVIGDYLTEINVTSPTGLRAIKRLVDEAGINLAGVQRLLSIAEVVQRMRPLKRDEPLSTREARRLAQEIDHLCRLLGFD